LKFLHRIKTVLFTSGMVVIMMMPLQSAQAALSADCYNADEPDVAFGLRLCESHAGCALVTRIAKTCQSVQNFIKAIGFNGKGNAKKSISDDDVMSAISASGESLSSISQQCISMMGRPICARIFRLPDEDVAVEPTPVKKSRQEELNITYRVLLNEYEAVKPFSSSDRPQGFYVLNWVSIERCNKEEFDRAANCRGLQQEIDKCLSKKASWEKRRDAFVAEAGNEGLTSLRTDLAKITLPQCMTTVPGTNMTPLQAVAEWDKQEQDASNATQTCRNLRTTVAASIDAKNFDLALQQNNQFQEKCGTNTYFPAVIAEYRQYITEGLAKNKKDIPRAEPVAKPTNESAELVLPTRTGSNATGALSEGLSQAQANPNTGNSTTESAQEWQVRQQQEAAARASNGGSSGMSAEDTREIVSALGNLAGAYLQSRAARNAPPVNPNAMLPSDTSSGSSSSNCPKNPATGFPSCLNGSSSSRSNNNSPAPSPRPTTKTKMHNPANDGTLCVKGFEYLPNYQKIRNECKFPVSVHWQGGTIDLRMGGTWPAPNGPYFACRFGGYSGAGVYVPPEWRGTGKYICHD
jgi:hypothetical protein